MEEDWNTIAADCVIISSSCCCCCCCCCQCLVLQIVVFILLKLPYKLIRKTKHYVKKKLGNPKRQGNHVIERETDGGYADEVSGRSSFGIQLEGFSLNGCGNCMEEVEKALEDLCEKGEFAFGSFWGGDQDLLEESCFSAYLVEQLERDDSKYHSSDSVDYTFGSFSCV